MLVIQPMFKYCIDCENRMAAMMKLFEHRKDPTF